MICVIELTERVSVYGYRLHVYGPFMTEEAAARWINQHRVCGRIMPPQTNWDHYPKSFKIRELKSP